MQESLASLLEKHLEDLSSKDLWTQALASYFKKETLSRSVVEQLLLDALQSPIRTVEEQQKACFKILQVTLLIYPDRALFIKDLKNAIRNVLCSGSFIEDSMTRSMMDLLAEFLSISWKMPSFTENSEEISPGAKQCYLLIFPLLQAAYKKETQTLEELYVLIEKQEVFLDHKLRPWTALWQTAQEHSRKKTFLAFYLLYFCAAYIYKTPQFIERRDALFSYLQKEGMVQSAFFVCLVTTWVEEHLPKDFSFSSKQGSFDLIDREKAVVGFREEEQSAIYTLLGNKTSIGAFQYEKVQVVSFGPQRFPLSDDASFGIDYLDPLQREKTLECSASSTIYSIKGWAKLPHSAQWMHIDVKSALDATSLTVHLRGALEEPVAFVFYIRAGFCELLPNTILYPKSLDHYIGTAKTIAFAGDRKKMVFRSAVEEEVQVIPLVGEGYFWDADFLLSFALKKGQEQLKIDVQYTSTS